MGRFRADIGGRKTSPRRTGAVSAGASAANRRQLLADPCSGLRLDLGPRFCGARAWRTPASRSRRQVVNNDEYSPSLRSSAPTPPEPLAWSAFVRMLCLYSAVKRRRLAWATTSGAGGAAPALASVALRVE